MLPLKKTKIVTTIGPATDTVEHMTHLMQMGVNVFRFNMKHNTVPWHEERIQRADKIAKELGIPLGILVDLQGPEIRLETRDKQPVEVKKGEAVRFVQSLTQPEDKLCLPHEILFEIIKAGEELLIDDGFQEFDIISVEPTVITAVAREAYTVSNRKGVNFPGKDISIPSLIDADIEKLDMATRNKVDFVGLSFCRSKQDIDMLRKEMQARSLDAAIIAKIESRQSLDNFDEIVQNADAIMVGRGDLGVEIPIEELAFWQKQLVYRCRLASKPVIVATQMLQSMIDNPRPTRAEATDVANAIWDGTDAIMLSGESAYGKYPFKAVETMVNIANYNEPRSFVPELTPFAENATQAVVRAAMSLVNEQAQISPAAILVFTQSGYTARVVSAYRPQAPIIAVTNSKKVLEQLALSYAVSPVFADFPAGNYELPVEFLSSLKLQFKLNAGDTLLVIHGSHWQSEHSTNSFSFVTV